MDAYAAKHPGEPSRQSIHSVGVHLIRLCLFLEHGLSEKQANSAMLRAGKNKQTFVWLDPPEVLGSMTLADVVKASSAQEHHRLVQEWAHIAWASWPTHHDTIRKWLADSQGTGHSPIK